MIYLLIFLLVMLPLLQGCTAMNYHMGKDLDESYPRKKVLVKEYENVEIGNTVEIVLKDKTRIRGRVSNLKLNDEIILRDIGLNGKERFSVQTIKFENIQRIYQMEYEKEFRYGFAAFGFLMDVIIIFLIWLSQQPPWYMMA